MKPYQQQLLDTAFEQEALKFGKYQLKSGRISPYFFNAGLFHTGGSIYQLASCYADKIIDSDFEFDVLFGPAYKGISLVAVISAVLFEKYNMNVGFCYNRKEAKDHGEGGIMVGAALSEQRVLIIDDVITAGTAIEQVMKPLTQENADVTGVLLALDRQEKTGQSDTSAIAHLQAKYDISIQSIINLEHIIEYAKHFDRLSQHFEALKTYRDIYGI